MNTYICFWSSLRIEVEAKTSLEAQEKATHEFQKSSRRKVKSFDVTVVLAKKGDELVIHVADF